jgi:hypothetical protein
MPEMQNFHLLLVFSELVIHQNGAMRKFPHTRPLADGGAHVGETSQQFNVVKQRITEAGSSLGVVVGNVVHDFREIG